MWPYIAVILVAYFLGSIPFGYIVGRFHRIDIRNYGSHNIGATNVLRVLGKRAGYTVSTADALKGFLAARLAMIFASRLPGLESHSAFLAILAAAACVFGHTFPVWLGFKGGKGVATSAGSIFGIMPIAAAAILLVWLLVFQTTRYVSVASIGAACTLPVAVAILFSLGRVHEIVLLYFSLAMSILVVWRHRSNLSRLFNGTEPRFTRK